jgi:hypothetical protein
MRKRSVELNNKKFSCIELLFCKINKLRCIWLKYDLMILTERNYNYK